MKGLCAYLRIPPPSKGVFVVVEEQLKAHPLDVDQALISYWTRLEAWPSEAMCSNALENFLDRYSFLIPVYKMRAWPDSITLTRIASRLKQTSPGLDGWGVNEVKLLPRESWRQLLDLPKIDLNCLKSSSSVLFRRVPILKTSESPGQESFRPIDVYSVIVRYIFTSVCSLIQEWLAYVVHPSQFASIGGPEKRRLISL